MHCSKGKSYIDSNGQIRAKHVVDKSWDLKKFVTFVRETYRISWREIYWKVWSYLYVFRCDSCREIFTRDRAKMSPKRLSNNYFHCCSHCDAKRFAQRKGAERRTIWDKPASSLDDISRL